MLNFIVLGLVPGTHTQLSFNLLVLAIAVLIAPFFIAKLVRFATLQHRTHQLFLDIVSI